MTAQPDDLDEVFRRVAQETGLARPSPSHNGRGQPGDTPTVTAVTAVTQPAKAQVRALRAGDTAGDRPMTPHPWWTAQALMTATFPEPRWAVPGLVAEGLTLVVGPPKVGKSWLALNLALAVAAGGRALGKVPVQRGKVAYLALEDTPRRLQGRMRMMLGDEPAPHGLGITTLAPTLDDGLLDLLAALDLAEVRLIVVDVLERVRPRGDTRDGVYQRDYQAVAALKAFADHHGVALAVLHHTRKAKSDDFLDTVSGTHGLAGAADALLLMQRTRGSADAVLHVTGRDVEEAEHAMRFDPTRGTWSLLDGPAADHTLSDVRARILTHLREHGPMSPKAIASGLGLPHDTVKQTAWRMAGDGQLDTDGNGVYLAPVTALSPELSPTETPADQQEPTPGDSGDTGDTPPVTGLSPPTELPL